MTSSIYFPQPTSGLRVVAPVAEYAQALSVLDAAGAELARVAGIAKAHGLLDPEYVSTTLQHVLKSSSAAHHRTARRASVTAESPEGWDDGRSLTDVRHRQARCFAEMMRLQAAMSAAGVQFDFVSDVVPTPPLSGPGPSAAPSTKRGPGRPRKDRLEDAKGLVPVAPAHPFATDMVRAIASESVRPTTALTPVPAEGAGAFPVLGSPTGYRAGKSPKSERDAYVRERLLGPLLQKQKHPDYDRPVSADEVAQGWRALIAGEDSRLTLTIEGLEPDECERFSSISGRTLRYWRKAVLAAHAEDRALNRPPRPARDVLRHEYPVERGAAGRREREDALRAKIIGWLDDRNREQKLRLSGAQVAQKLKAEGMTISTRKVQLVIESLGDRLRAELRGDPESCKRLFSISPLREVEHPNEEWLMDNSWLRFSTLSAQERKEQLADPSLPTSDYAEDFQLDFLDVQTSELGDIAWTRTDGCYLTVILDACTRRVLALRIWSRPVGAAEMLLVLREAMMRFGRPDRLYTDNGSEFRNKTLREALHLAGITHVFSKPYNPKGRGKVERVFRTIKALIQAAGIPGFYGGESGGVRASIENLLPLTAVQGMVWDLVERQINRQIHGTTKRRPAEHYDEAIRDRYAITHLEIGLGEDVVMPLLLQCQVKRQDFGIAVNGHHYYGPGLEEIMLQRTVWVAYDPWRWQEVYFQRPADADKSRLEFRGVARWYDRKNKPPELQERIEARAQYRLEYAAQLAEQGAKSRQAARRRRATATARVAKEPMDAMADPEFGSPVPALGRGDASAQRMLPSGSPETGDVLETGLASSPPNNALNAASTTAAPSAYRSPFEED